MLFTEHAYEIFTVANKLNIDYPEAFDRFKAAVETNDIHSGNVGDTLPGTDFAALHAKFTAMPTNEQADAYNEWHEFLRDKREDATAAYGTGKAAMQTLVADWQAQNGR